MVLRNGSKDSFLFLFLNTSAKAYSKQECFLLSCTLLSLYLHNIGCGSAYAIQNKNVFACLSLTFHYIFII